MGETKYDSRDHIDSRQGAAASGATAFQFTLNASRGGLAIHQSLDPKYGGKRRSQSLKDGTPKVSVVWVLDETGSRADDVRKNYDQLPKVMALLTGLGWLGKHKLDLQIIGCGDAYTDSAPLQISQFEGDGPTIDKWLSRLYLEGNGGGTSRFSPIAQANVPTETYELAMWAAVNQNELDCWKQGEKGYIIFMFDETPYLEVDTDLLYKLYNSSGPAPDVTGDNVELSVAMRAQTIKDIRLPKDNIPLATMAAELVKKYHVFGITSNGSSHYTNPDVLKVWRTLFGEESIIQLPDANDAPELIAAIIARSFGAATTAITKDLIALNTSSSVMGTITRALAVRDAAEPMKGDAQALSGEQSSIVRL